ncbi:hypothetical protein ACLOJK_010987 [Asimina triloba]
MPPGSKKKRASKKKKHHNNKRINHNSQEGNVGKDDDVISQDEKEATTSTTSGGNLSDSPEKRMEGASENGNREGGSVGDVSIEHPKAVKGSDGGESYGDDASSGCSSDDERRDVEITSSAPGPSTDIGVVEKDALPTEAAEVSAVERVVPLSEVASEPAQAGSVERVVPLSEAAPKPGQAASVASVVPVSEVVVEVVEAAAAGKPETVEVKEAKTVKNLPVPEAAESVPVDKSEVVQVKESTSVENSEVIPFPPIKPTPIENSGSSGGVASPRTEGNDKMPLPPSDLNPSQEARDGSELLKETERKEQHVLLVVPPVHPVHQTSWLSCCGLLDFFRRSD